MLRGLQYALRQSDVAGGKEAVGQAARIRPVYRYAVDGLMPLQQRVPRGEQRIADGNVGQERAEEGQDEGLGERGS